MGGDAFRDEYSLAFDGTNDNIRIPEITLDVDDSNLSIVFWAKRGALGGTNTIIGHTDDANIGHIRFNSANAIRFESNTNDDEAVITQNTIDTNWHHYVIVANSGTVTAFQDGVSCSVTGDVGDTPLDIDTIGGSGDTGVHHEWLGNISEIAIYNSNMDISQAKTMYNSGEPFNHKDWRYVKNLTQWWRFGDGVNDITHVMQTDTGGIVGDEVDPTIGSTLWDADASVFTSGTYNWSEYDGSSITNDSNTLKIVKDDDSTAHGTNGAYVYLKNVADLSSDLTVGKVYKLTFDAKVDSGDTVKANVIELGNTINASVVITNTSFQTFTLYFLAGSATGVYFRIIDMATGEIAWVDNFILQEIGGSAGLLQNMDADSDTGFTGVTP